MMKITGLSHLFKWENLHNWWLTKYFFAPLYVCTYEEFVLETEAPQCDRMTASGQDTDNKNNNIQIFKIDNVQK